MDLRSKLIRLAHAKPELRPHLLPLLKTAAGKVPTNEANWKKFKEAYQDGLLLAVRAKPDNYAMQGRTPEEYAETVAKKMLGTMEKEGITAVNLTNSQGFKNACKKLGISYTVKSIVEFLTK